jgi:outer membrane lipoprotein-sorting protein
MRIFLALIAILFLTPLLAIATPADDAGIDSVLKQLEEVGKNLKSFSAKVKLDEIDSAFGTDTARVGNVQFQRAADGSARIHVTFIRVDLATRKAFPKDKIEYLLDGQWLIDRNYGTHNEVKRQVLKQGQKMDLFKLGEGPFPLPIGQTPADVHKQFNIQKLATSKDEPANSVHLQLIPKPGTDLERRFKSLDVWVDEKTHMPVRVDTADKQQTVRSTELSDLTLNPPAGLPDTDFQLPDIEKENWNRHVESLND